MCLEGNARSATLKTSRTLRPGGWRQSSYSPNPPNTSTGVSTLTVGLHEPPVVLDLCNRIFSPSDPAQMLTTAAPEAPKLPLPSLDLESHLTLNSSSGLQTSSHMATWRQSEWDFAAPETQQERTMYKLLKHVGYRKASASSKEGNHRRP